MNKVPFILFVFIILILSSCNRDNSTTNNNSLVYKEDPNNYFTASFNGITLKTNGFIYADAYGNNIAGPSTASISTENTNNSIVSKSNINVFGGILNSSFAQYGFPFQALDVFIYLKKSGNNLGTYNIDVGVGWITDLKVAKQYDFDPNSTIFNIISVDATYIQGAYTGELIDGNTKIPVSGNFKLRR